MTQITINIENKSIIPHLRKILNSIEGVFIAKPVRKKKNGLDLALEDIEKGRVEKYSSSEELFKSLASRLGAERT